MSQARQNIVIVGGGFAGSYTAKAIAAKLDASRYRLILVSPRPFFVHLPAMIRCSVTSEGKLEQHALMPYGDFLRGKGEVKVAEVASFTSTENGNGGGIVTLDNGEQIQYTILVLATGNLWNGPLHIPVATKEVEEQFASWRNKFEKANDIILVGGGSVAVEYAGEIKDFFPSKRVTIIQNDSLLLNKAYPVKYRRAVLARIRKTGTQVILNDALENLVPSNGGVTTRNGELIAADLVVPTWGGRPNTQLVRDALGDSVLTSSGHVRVLPTLQVAAHPRIFAAGDIIDWDEQKQAAKMEGHAAVVAANVLSLLNGTVGKKVYKGSPEAIIITVGRYGGSTYLGFLWGFVLGDWFSSIIKSRHLLVSMMRKSFGFPAP